MLRRMRNDKGTRARELRSADGAASGSLSSNAGLQKAVSVYGLPYACWACGEVGTPLVALADGAARVADDLVVCDTPELLGLADQLLPDDVRRDLRIGRVRLRYTRTSRTPYLANECGACRAVFGQWPNLELFHQMQGNRLSAAATAQQHAGCPASKASEYSPVCSTR